jgi:hypothetical protein
MKRMANGISRLIKMAILVWKRTKQEYGNAPIIIVVLAWKY